MSAGQVTAGSLVSLYPGTVYQPQDPVLLQSVANQFILRCYDGVLLDGKSRGMSRLIYNSCVGRDQVRATDHPLTDCAADRNDQSSGHQLVDVLASQSSLRGAGTIHYSCLEELSLFPSDCQ